jgi:hypothetical protein
MTLEFSPDGGRLGIVSQSSIAVGTERTGLHFYDLPPPAEHLARILKKNRLRLDGLEVVPAE